MADFEATPAKFLQDNDPDILSGLFAPETMRQADIGIWQRSHDQRLNKEIAYLLSALGADGIELLIKMHDAPVNLMRAVRQQLAATLPSDRTYPYLEADITRQILLFAQHSKAGVIHLRLSSHEKQIGDLPDGDFTTYQVTIYDGQKRDESQLLKSTMDLRPGNTVGAAPRQNLARHMQQPQGQFLFLRLGSQQIRDTLPAEETITLTAEHVLGEYADSEFTSNTDLPPTPEQQIEQKMLSALAKLDLLAESVRHPQAAPQQEKFLLQLPKLLQKLVQPEVLRALSPAAALQVSTKLTDMVRAHPMLEHHPQLPKVVRATEQINQIILATIPVGMRVDLPRQPLELISSRQQQLGAAILTGRVKTAQSILAYYELPNAKVRIEALLPQNTNGLFKPDLPVARALVDLRQTVKAQPVRRNIKLEIISDKSPVPITNKPSVVKAAALTPLDMRKLMRAVLTDDSKTALREVGDLALKTVSFAIGAAMQVTGGEKQKPGTVALAELKDRLDKLPKDASLAQVIELVGAAKKHPQLVNQAPELKQLEQIQGLLSAVSTRFPDATTAQAVVKDIWEIPTDKVGSVGIPQTPSLDKTLIPSVPDAKSNARIDSTQSLKGHSDKTVTVADLNEKILVFAEALATPAAPSTPQPIADSQNKLFAANDKTAPNTRSNETVLHDTSQRHVQQNLFATPTLSSPTETPPQNTATQSALMDNVAVRSDFTAGELWWMAFDERLSNSVRQEALHQYRLKEGNNQRFLPTTSADQDQTANSQQDERHRKQLEDALRNTAQALSTFAPASNIATPVNNAPQGISVQNLTTEINHSSQSQPETFNSAPPVGINLPPYMPSVPANENYRPPEMIFTAFIHDVASSPTTPPQQYSVEVIPFPQGQQNAPEPPAYQQPQTVSTVPSPPEHGPGCNCQQCEGINNSESAVPPNATPYTASRVDASVTAATNSPPAPPEHGPGCSCDQCKPRTEAQQSYQPSQTTGNAPAPPEHGPGCSCEQCRPRAEATNSYQPAQTVSGVPSPPEHGPGCACEQCRPAAGASQAYQPTTTVASVPAPPEHGPGCACEQCTPNPTAGISGPPITKQAPPPRAVPGAPPPPANGL